MCLRVTGPLKRTRVGKEAERVKGVDKGLFQWDFGEGLSEVVFERSPERSGEENQADILGQSLPAKDRNRRVPTVQWGGQCGWREMNKGGGGGQTIHGAGASLGQPRRLWWELGLLLWITWRHPAFRMDGSRKLWKWRAKSPRTMGSLLLWIQLLTSSWANRMFPAQPPEGSTFCRHRKRELGYVPPQAQSNPARGQSGCFAWKNFHLAFHAFFMGQNQIGQYATRKFGSQNSVYLPG